MTTLHAILPKPVQNVRSKWAADDSDDEETLKTSVQSVIPKYMHRRNYTPKAIEDYGNGGAFPELLFAQYPLDMGRKTSKTNAIPLTADDQGNLNYDTILQQKTGKNKIIHSKLADFQQQDISNDNIDRPDQAQIDAAIEKTQSALDKIINNKIKTYAPKLNKMGISDPATFVRYTPQTQGENSLGTSRIVKLVTAPVDPMEPARFGHKKIPRGPPSPPPPVLHSPPRKVTVEEQKNWMIPPCISNWKNAKGYTIPLDKRLAADGRGVQKITINDNFAKLSEALFIADRHARDEVKIRSEMQQKLIEKEKREAEEKLRVIAQRARDAHLGISKDGRGDGGDSSSSTSDDDDDTASDLDEEERQKIGLRNEIRKDRALQREREMRTGRSGKNSEQQRDISEKVALGMAQPTAAKETLYDQRLFNQSAGIGSGFGDSDSYGIYDKALFTNTQHVYRPQKSQTDESSGGAEFEKIIQSRAHKGFNGTTDLVQSATSAGPIQFEKELDDVFGVEDFMAGSSRKRDRPVVQGGGTMHAAASSSRKEDYAGRSSSDRKIAFEDGSSDDRYKKNRRTNNND